MSERQRDRIGRLEADAVDGGEVPGILPHYLLCLWSILLDDPVDQAGGEAEAAQEDDRLDMEIPCIPCLGNAFSARPADAGVCKGGGAFDLFSDLPAEMLLQGLHAPPADSLY